MKKVTSLFLILVSVLLLTSCGKAKLYKKTFLYFDTEITISIFSNNHYAQAAFENIDETLSFYHSLTNRYEKEKDGIIGVYTINNSNGIETIVSKELIDLINDVLSYEYILNDDGKPYFTIGIGALSDLWHPYFENDESSLFPDSELLSKTYNTDVLNIIIDEKNNTITLKERLKLDLGGVVKGYVSNLLVKKFDKENVKYIINMGSSSIITNIGNPKRKNNAYIIGLTNPNITIDGYVGSNIYGKINLPLNTAISTSGDYQKYIIYENKLYSSIIDPYTSYPVDTDIRSISVLHLDPLYGDILSTTLFMMGKEKALSYAKAHNLEIILYTNTDEIFMTDGIKEIYSH